MYNTTGAGRLEQRLVIRPKVLAIGAGRGVVVQDLALKGRKYRFVYMHTHSFPESQVRN